MSRYIDLDKFGRGRLNPDVLFFENLKYAEGWNTLIDLLEKADVEDVVENKHGT